MPEDRPAPVPLSSPAPGEQSATRTPVPLPTPSTSRTSLEPMPRRVIATVAAVIATATIGLVVALWWVGTAGLSGAELVNARFNALRTGLSIGVGGGGIFALYLAWRRQYATEIGLVQKERDQADVVRAYELQREVAATTERDAEARRITDLYAKSVEQLGSDKAPVRHGGLYALERLAQDHPEKPALRQTVVNVLCAYLRAPFDIPGDPPDASADQAARVEHRERVQEREVRLTAQRILTTHVNPDSDTDQPTMTFWANTDFDLTAAVLIDWDTRKCLLRNATFRGATFTGDATFSEATFTGNAAFDEATFTGNTRFDEATFTGDAAFSEATFTWNTSFIKATFTGDAFFDEVTFTEDAWFGGVTFTGDASFTGATFTKNAVFIKATFTGNTWFNEATFTWNALCKEATSRHDPAVKSSYSKSWPAGWQLSLDHTAIEGRQGTWHRILATDDDSTSPEDLTFESIDD
ncbi:pentapeptide repeat-containing protein [Saccharothrix sp. Mg75]|uniref:pentapeptide repeat-containing protein n=1 Tax=Saccharothrix sp. Mg75 TaxID=3445357 RepID=UPI003EEED3BE